MSIMMMKILAKMMPTSYKIEKVEQDLLAYKLAPSKDTREALIPSLMLLIVSLEDEDKSIEEIVTSSLEEDKKRDAVNRLFDVDNKN